MDAERNSHYDTVIIGAGMSGLAAGIRLAHFDHNVLILERHNAPGGLNSFYSFDGRKFDVGLHAVTNFVPRGARQAPLVKLYRQLRIDPDEFGLCEQWGSRIAFPGIDLRFSNDFDLLASEVRAAFPREIDGFLRLTEAVKEFDAFNLQGEDVSARKVVAEYLRDPVLTEMIFCPLMYYGSASEDDMDFAQFAIMFRAIFCEGFARPQDGVRRIIRVLLKRFRQLGGKRKMKCGVRELTTEGGRVSSLVLDNGSTITADHVLSSIGAVETERLCDDRAEDASESTVGRLSFVETIQILDCPPCTFGWDDTIVFFNATEKFRYARPEELVDPDSGVICFPNNYHYPPGENLPEGVFRVTALADFEGWTSLPEEDYRKAKDRWRAILCRQAQRFLKPLKGTSVGDHTVYIDMFTPRTIEYYTGHLQGAVYGARRKIRDGRTHLENLYLCGTDQGFLGIIGAMLSGISMANHHILRRELAVATPT